MNDYLHCSVCDFDYTHIIGTIQVKDNDNYQTTEFIVNHEYRISAEKKYNFRSQGNIHILLRCEEGHFFIKSFDGHKGNVHIDENPLMDELAYYLNKVYKKQKELTLYFDFELLGNIEKFLKQN